MERKNRNWKREVFSMDTLLCEANKVATSHTSQVRRGRGSGFNAVAMAGEGVEGAS